MVQNPAVGARRVRRRHDHHRGVHGTEVAEVVRAAPNGAIEFDVTVEPLHDGDVVVVAQKVVSKVEGRARAIAQVTPGAEASEAAARAGKDPAVVELIVSESQELMRVAPGVIIARHRTGHVLANAGIDASNLPCGGEEAVLLWPEDPDASARRLRAALETAFGVRLAVIVSDSLGRAWRMGTTGSAIGSVQFGYSSTVPGRFGCRVSPSASPGCTGDAMLPMAGTGSSQATSRAVVATMPSRLVTGLPPQVEQLF